MKLERELEQINSQKYVVQDKICEFEEKTNILEELIGTLKSGSSAEKLLEWHHKILSLRFTSCHFFPKDLCCISW